MTEVTAARAGQADQGHGGHGAMPGMAMPAASMQTATAAQQSSGGGFTPIAAYGGLAIGVIALVLALRRPSAPTGSDLRRASGDA